MDSPIWQRRALAPWLACLGLSAPGGLLWASEASAEADGLSVDIEGYSGPPSDLTSFVRELRAALPAVGGKRAQLSVCVGAWPINPHYKRIHYGDGYDYASLVAPGAADFLFVMAYDME